MTGAPQAPRQHARPTPPPTRAALRAARRKTVPDVLRKNLHILFVGINPGLYTAAVGHHFGRPGNRFWPALAAGGLTPRLFHPSEQRQLLALGIGITNMVARASASAGELSASEIRAGGRVLESKVRRYKPRHVVFLGLGAYRTAFNRPHARIGQQKETIGPARVWVFPNPSGLNAHHRAADFARWFRRLRRVAGSLKTMPGSCKARY